VLKEIKRYHIINYAVNEYLAKERDCMKCPYCGREMYEGYIYNGQQPNQWLPKGVMPSRIVFTATDKGITLKNKFSFFKQGGYCAEAFYCYKCRIMIAAAD